MNKIKIVSDGTAIGTRVYAVDIELKNISEIRINTILPSGNVIAHITFINVELDLVANIEEQ